MIQNTTSTGVSSRPRTWDVGYPIGEAGKRNGDGETRRVRTRVLVVVLAGGAGSRLAPLTDCLAKPAVPFGGMCRLIDITLSNVAHSGLSDVWVIEQYEPHALNDHLANGRPWDLDRTHGGLQILPPFQGRGDDDALAAGNANALVLNRRPMAGFDPDVVITMSADHVYRLDLRDVLDTHHQHDAALRPSSPPTRPATRMAPASRGSPSTEHGSRGSTTAGGADR